MREELNKDTALHPPAMTDKELINFAVRFMDTGMPLSFQKELLFRFDKRVNG